MMVVDKKDWRVGLQVKPTNSNNPLGKIRWTVVGVFTDGEHGIRDKEGVLRLQPSVPKNFSSAALFVGAMHWKTADNALNRDRYTG